MGGPRRTVLGLVVAGLVAGCQLVAGIEDLRLTGAADASAADAPGDVGMGSDATLADSPSGADAVSGDGAVDASVEASADAPADSPAGTDAAEASLTYAQEVLLDQPLAFWRFDETSGTTAVDSSGHGNDGTYAGGVTLGVTGAIANDGGTAAAFDGMTGFMTAGDVFEFTGPTPCSFEAWVNPILDADFHDILSRSDGQGGTTTGYLMYVEPQPTPMMDFALYSAGSGDIAESDGVNIDGGAYTQVVGVYDGTNVIIYANGAPLMTNTASFTIPATTSPFVVAAQSGGATSWFHGDIDDVSVYGQALSAARILVHYRVGIGLPPQ
jgi:hypothetical protein